MYAEFTSPKFFHYRVAALVNARRILAGMAVYRFLFLVLCNRNINEIRRLENHGLLSGAYFKKIQLKFVWGAYPALNGQQAGYLVIFMGCLLYTSDAADEEDSVDL